MKHRKKILHNNLRWNAASLLIRACSELLQLVLLTRFLDPHYLGIFAIVGSLLIFFKVFSDSGINAAILHFQDVSKEDLSTVFLFNCAIAVFIVVLLNFCAYPMALFYKEPCIEHLIRLTSIVVLINSLSSQYRSIGQKNFLFSRIFIIDFISMTIGIGLLVYLLNLGLGIYAPIISLLTTSFASAVFSLIFLNHLWIPSFTFHLDKFKRFFTFGRYMLGSNLLNSINNQIDILLGGRILGADRMGFYSSSKNLNLYVQFFINPVLTQVATPLMAIKDKQKNLKSIYLKLLCSTNSLNFPCYFLIFFNSREMTTIFFGEAWALHFNILKFLALWGAVRGIYNPIGSLLVSTGQVGLSFKWNFFIVLILPFFVFLGCTWEIYGLIFSQLLMLILIGVPSYLYVLKPTIGVHANEYLDVILRPMLVSALSFFVSYILAITFLQDPFSLLMISSVLGTVFYFLLSWKFNRQFLCELLEVILGKYCQNEEKK